MGRRGVTTYEQYQMLVDAATAAEVAVATQIAEFAARGLWVECNCSPHGGICMHCGLYQACPHKPRGGICLICTEGARAARESARAALNALGREKRRARVALYNASGAEERWHDRTAGAGIDDAKRIVDVSSGWHRLRHIYGPSYYGSGCGWGGIATFDEAGSLVRSRVRGLRDDGFAQGPDEVLVPAGHIVVAHGGDSLSAGGRTWYEAFRGCRDGVAP